MATLPPSVQATDIEMGEVTDSGSTVDGSDFGDESGLVDSQHNTGHSHAHG